MINQIKKCLRDAGKKMISDKVYGDKNWTEAIKKSLGQLGIANGFKICAATEEKEFETEWLYDLVWYKENADGFLIDIPLVVESEWKKGLIKDIKFDFEKLLLARCGIRLMICNCDENRKANYIEYFQKAINVCPLVKVEDLYLIAILKLEGIDVKGFEFIEMKKHG